MINDIFVSSNFLIFLCFYTLKPLCFDSVLSLYQPLGLANSLVYIHTYILDVSVHIHDQSIVRIYMHLLIHIHFYEYYKR